MQNSYKSLNDQDRQRQTPQMPDFLASLVVIRVKSQTSSLNILNLKSPGSNENLREQTKSNCIL